MAQSIIRAGIRGEGYTRLRHAVTHLEPFTTAGSLTGSTRAAQRHVPCGFYETGYLRGEELDAFHAAYPHLRYVVRSYFTPIAWVTDDGRVHYVRQKFSVTTSKHQGAIYGLGDAVL